MTCFVSRLLPQCRLKNWAVHDVRVSSLDLSSSDLSDLSSTESIDLTNDSFLLWRILAHVTFALSRMTCFAYDANTMLMCVSSALTSGTAAALSAGSRTGLCMI